MSSAGVLCRGKWGGCAGKKQELLPFAQNYSAVTSWSVVQCAVPCRAVCCATQVTVDGPGSLITMPGTLAKHYSEQLGGVVQLMGKPDPLIYAAAQELTGGSGPDVSSRQPQQWLAIGDSLEHDIAG